MKDMSEPAICTTSGRPVDVVRAEQTEATGQHKDYIVLCPDERAKGFVRPYRDAYKHVGKEIERDADGRIVGRLIQGTDPEYKEHENEHYTRANGYGGFLQYPEGGHVVGRYVTLEEVDAIVNRKTHFGGCGTVTTMGPALSETYARDPKFYGATFCVGCNKHLPVGEFIWTQDGTEVGL